MIHDHEKRMYQPFSRRTLFRAGGLFVVTSTVGCSSDEYALTERFGTIYDEPLSEHSDRGIRNISFKHNPQKNGGAIVALIHLKSQNPEGFRVTSREEKPKSGFMFDEAYKNGQGDSSNTYEIHPVVGIGKDSQHTVFIGVGASTQETYQSMRTYQIFPKLEFGMITGLEGSFIGFTDLKPNPPLLDN